jgi:hypothetical protein
MMLVQDQIVNGKVHAYTLKKMGTKIGMQWS